MRKILLAFAVCFSLSSFSERQLPDFLEVGNQSLILFSNPLESYFVGKQRPTYLLEKYGYKSRDCERGYVAFWRFYNDSLYLTQVEGANTLFSLNKFFPKEKVTKRGVFAYWYSGSILHPYGGILCSVNRGYETVYKYEKEFVIENGIRKQENKYDNSKSIVSVYAHDPSYLNDFFARQINWELIPQKAMGAKVVVKILEISPTGKILNVDIQSGYSETLNHEAMRVVKLIPKWDYLYRHGQPISHDSTITVVFENEFR